MKSWTTLWRFRKPLEFFVPQLRDKFNEVEHNRKVESAFKVLFNSTQGEIVLRHLVKEYGLDAQIGNIPSEDVAYISAQQDVIKHILSLVN